MGIVDKYSLTITGTKFGNCTHIMRYLISVFISIVNPAYVVIMILPYEIMIKTNLRYVISIGNPPVVYEWPLIIQGVSPLSAIYKS